ncbi:MAG: hypothetical protein ACYC28_02145 [Longimicrobiales bacterium]
MATGFLALALLLTQQAQPAPEAIRADARRVEAAYERAARRFAPVVGQRTARSGCDEIVGRFCITFDAEPADPPDEPPRITDARRAAIDSLRRQFSVLPGDPAVAGPLVRLLIEDERPAEAVAAALTFDMETADSAFGPLLAGFALHASGEDSVAGEYFERALAHLEPDEQRRVRSLDWLIRNDERGRYRELADTARETYEQIVWKLSDPLYLTPANELWLEHVSRYTYGRLMERVQVVRDMVRWRSDLEQLTIRYGVPYRRGRYAGVRFDESGIVEYYHPEQLTYMVGDYLTKGMPPQPPPGESWPLDPEKPRSAFAPGAVRNMDELPHQVSRIPVADGWLVRVDGTFGLDTLARAPLPPLPGDTASPPPPEPAEVDAGFWLLDMQRRAEETGSTRVAEPLEADTAHLALSLAVPPGEYVYSFEGFEPETRTARRARYALSIEEPESGLRLSDVIITRPFNGALPETQDGLGDRPLGTLVLERDSYVGIFAQAADPGSGSYEVEVAVKPADRGSLPGRFVRWLGRTLGLSDEPVPPRVSWRVVHGEGPLVIAADLALTGTGSGLQIIEVAIEDARGRRGVGQRLVRIE